MWVANARQALGYEHNKLVADVAELVDDILGMLEEWVFGEQQVQDDGLRAQRERGGTREGASAA